MNPSQSYNQPPGAYNSSEKSVMLQPAAAPSAYQNNPAGYPPSFPSQPVPQGPYNQPPGAYNSSEKSVMLQPAAAPPAYQHNPAGYPPSFPSQPVRQGRYAQGPYSGQTVVATQPTVFVTAAPLANPAPDYMCYSIFSMLCCCLPLGIAALVFSCSTQDANYAGQRELAEKKSKTARTLNHVAVALGLLFIVLYIIYYFVLSNNMNQHP